MGLVDAITGRLCRGLAVCAALSVALLAVRTSRAEGLGPILLSYDAPDGCPDVGDFQRKVEQRSSHVHFVDEGSHDKELAIRLRQVGDRIAGELRLIEKDGSLRQRSVRFNSCAEAVEGLALITAVSLDPQALTTAPAAAAPVEVARAAEPKPAPPRPTPPRRPPPLAPPVPASRSALVASLGAEFDASTALLPAPALGGALFLDLSSSRRSWLNPLFRLALSHVERRGVTVQGSAVEAQFAFTLATLSACPVQWDAGSFVLRPCARAVGGLLRSWTSADVSRVDSRAFGAWGGSLMLFVPLGQAAEIVAEAGLNAPMLQYHFQFDDRPFLTTAERYLSTELGFRLHL